MAAYAGLGLVALLGLASPALAEDCRLALVLALDVSISVDPTEERLQREGLARALLAREVVRAFLAGDQVAVFAFEWSNATTQTPLTPGWMVVEDREDLVQIGQSILVGERTMSPSDFTAVGAALSYAGLALEQAPPCRARMIDVSGDGRNNDGPLPQAVYRAFPVSGVTVNALIVTGAEEEDRLIAWFESNVLWGPSAFWILANGFEDFERAMKAKLLRELEPRLVSNWLTSRPHPQG